MSAPGPAGADGGQAGENTCRDCAGTGRVGGEDCTGCAGSGVVVEVVGDA